MQVTITRLNSEGEYKGNCLFAGLAIYQAFREDLLLCSNRSFWSSNRAGTAKDANHIIPPINNMKLVLYSIKNFASVSVSLIFTLSACTGILVNPCEYEAYCDDNSFNSVCMSYLNSLSNIKVQFMLDIQYKEEFKSLHKIRFGNVTALVPVQKLNSCVQIYASSFVKARKQNIFQNTYHHYFLRISCFLDISPDISHKNSHKSQIEDCALYASFEGNINRLESLHISGLGEIIVNHLENYTIKKEKYTEIKIEKKDFNTKYKIALQYDINFNIATLSSIHQRKGTNFKHIDLAFQGGSNSTVLISLKVNHLQIMKEQGLVSTLTSWQMFNIMSPNYIVPLITNYAEGKTKHLLNILNKLKSVVYGYSLHLEMNGSSFHSPSQNVIVANLKIQTTFCLQKCKVDRSRNIKELKKMFHIHSK